MNDILEEVRLWEKAHRRCDPGRIRSLKEREYQYLQCFHRGGVEPEVAAKMYGFVLVNGRAVDQEVFYHYQQLKKEEKEEDIEG